MIAIKMFSVNQPNDWQPVANYLLTVAGAAPLARPDSENYSTSAPEARLRASHLVASGRGQEATRYTAVVAYKKAIMISLTLTIEPNDIHLSLAGVINGGLRRLSDIVAQEAAHAILGVCDEHQEGVMPQVRHYHRAIT